MNNTIKIIVSALAITLVFATGYFLVFTPLPAHSYTISKINLCADTTILLTTKKTTSDNCAISFVNNCKQGNIGIWIKNNRYPDYRFQDSVCAYLAQKSQNDSAKAILLWDIVASSGFHYAYEYNHQLPDHLEPRSLYSFPYFLCGEKAGIYYNLATECGLKARVIHLKNHIANEVYFNNNWHFIDADEGVLFKTNTGKILSAATLNTNRNLINNNTAVLASKSNFSPVWRYKNYFNTTIAQANSQQFSATNNKHISNKIVLEKNNLLTFNWHNTSLWKQFLNERYQFDGSGTLQQYFRDGAQLNTHDSITAITNYNAPFFPISITVAAPTAVPVLLYIQLTDRQTGTTQTTYIGNLNNHHKIEYHFEAPQTPQIHYQYKLIAKSNSAQAIQNVKATHTFSFNSEILNLPAGGVFEIEASQTSI